VFNQPIQRGLPTAPGDCLQYALQHVDIVILRDALQQLIQVVQRGDERLVVGFVIDQFLAQRLRILADVLGFIAVVVIIQ
jgi:hypothetical protein